MTDRLVWHDIGDATYHIPYFEVPLEYRNAIKLFEPSEDFITMYEDDIEGDPHKWPGNWKQSLDEAMYLPTETIGNYSILNTFKYDIDQFEANLTKNEEEELFKAAETDITARNTLIQSHLGLMFKIAKSQQRKFKRIELTEMLAEASLTLTELFDKLIGEKRFHRLYTIMYQPIIFCIKDLGRDGIVKTGKFKLQDMRLIRDTVKGMFMELLQMPTKEELLKKLGWGEKRYDNTFSSYNSITTQSYDKDNRLMLELYDPNIDEIREYNLEELIDWILTNELKERDAETVEYMFGIGGADKLTQSNIAELKGITRDGVAKSWKRAQKGIKNFFEKNPKFNVF